MAGRKGARWSHGRDVSHSATRRPRHARRLRGAKGVYYAAVRITLNAGVPAESGAPPSSGSFPAARLRRAVPAPHRENWPEVGVPLPTRRSAWWRAAETRTIPELHFHARRGVQENPIIWVFPGGSSRAGIP